MVCLPYSSTTHSTPYVNQSTCQIHHACQGQLGRAIARLIGFSSGQWIHTMRCERAKVNRICETDHDGASNRGPRWPVELAGYGVLDDGTTFGVSLVNLSYDGCQVETELALLPGIKFRFSVLGFGGTTEATVRWYKDGRAGLKFSFNDVLRTETPRKHCRLEVSAELSLRRMGRQRYQGRLFDLSPTGCKVEFVERPRPEEVLWVKFVDFDSIEATVRWIDGFYGGLEFARPIYPSVFELLLAKLQHGLEPAAGSYTAAP